MSTIKQTIEVSYSEDDIKRLIMEDLRERGHHVQMSDIRRAGGFHGVSQAPDEGVRIVHVTGYDVKQKKDTPYSPLLKKAS